MSSSELGVAAVKAVADMLAQNTRITRLDLAGNVLGEEGGKLLVDAIQQNKIVTDLPVWGMELAKAQELQLTALIGRNQMAAEARGHEEL